MKRLTVTLILAGTAALIGCGKDQNNGQAPSNQPPVWQPWTPPTGPGGNPGVNWEHGATSSLRVTNESLRIFTGWTPNNPTDVKLNLNLQRIEPAQGSNRPSFGGVVTVSFKDGGRTYEDQFTSMVNEGHWYGPGVVNTNRENNKYNVWITKNNRQAWHGFFQDQFGAVIVVIDDTDDLGDGNGPTRAAGSIWVMNFGQSYAPVSPTSCWFVSAGPYDCRTWKNGRGVNTDMDIYPYLENDNPGTAWAPKAVGYKKVGEFSNLEFRKAFNGYTP
jgi:hypothetical protein